MDCIKKVIMERGHHYKNLWKVKHFGKQWRLFLDLCQNLERRGDKWEHDGSRTAARIEVKFNKVFRTADAPLYCQSLHQR